MCNAGVSLRGDEEEHRSRLLLAFDLIDEVSECSGKSVRMLFDHSTECLVASPLLLGLLSPWLRDELSWPVVGEVSISVPELRKQEVLEALHFCKASSGQEFLDSRPKREMLRRVNNLLLHNEHIERILQEADEQQYCPQEIADDYADDNHDDDDDHDDDYDDDDDIDYDVSTDTTSCKDDDSIVMSLSEAEASGLVLSDSTLEANFSDQQARLVCLVCYKIFGSEEHQLFREHLFKHEHRALKKIRIRGETASLTTNNTKNIQDYPNNRPDILRRRGRSSTKSSVSSILTESSRSGESLQCPECPSEVVFGSRQGLLSHRRFAHAPRSLECSGCEKRLSSEYHLRRHVSGGCKGSRRCRLCDKTFVDHYRLKQHVRLVHQGLKLFQCEVCEKSFGERRTLREHLLTHKTHRLFKCHYCEKSFVQSNHLKSHLASAHNQGRHQCQQCDKSFAFPAQLSKHQMKAHPL